MINPYEPDFANTPVSPLRAKFGYAPAGSVTAPAVSILTPFYNAGEHFAATARSVMQQSLQNFEWLIVNDRSTDPESLRVLDEYRNADPRIRVIDCEVNGGPSRARNIGYAAARTPYIVQIDADDLLEPTAAEKWLWFLETHPEVAFVKGYSLGFDAEQYLWTRGFHCDEQFLQENPVQPNSLIRKQAHADAGGYDENNREGLEDWDFWLRMASAGHWGTTVPEYLDWYRRRATHSDRWDNWDSGSRQEEFKKQLAVRFAPLYRGAFPKIAPRYPGQYDDVPNELPFANPLAKERPRLLLIVPWMTMGGSDKFALDLVRQLGARGWEVTIATTREGDNNWLHEFARCTPDVFVVPNYVPATDCPRFLRYLIESRRPDAVLMSHSLLGYQLLPYLRSHHPEMAFLDYCHIEEHAWKNGGYPRFGVGYQELLDLNVVSSEHLLRWMVDRGADPERIEVCYTGVDTQVWKPDSAARRSFRGRYDIPEDAVVILFAGRLHPQKQPMVLARTLVALAQRGLSFHAVIAGDGEYRDQIAAEIARAPDAWRIRMIGAISTDAMKDAMAAADIFFLPSLWEGIALSLYEALSCGVAFVGAAVGGQRELVAEGTGFLIERSDEETEIRRYTELLGQLISDPELRRRMASAAREHARSFSLDAMADKMIACVDRARELAAQSPRPRVGKGLGLETAVQAIEHRRTEALADSLWHQRSVVAGRPESAGSPPLNGRRPSFGKRVVSRLKRMVAKRLRKGT
ncbi:MAG: glycosyltransferase [Planctomycetes bacterium]|nr:glycosyltransferase [Planctomycetota bacterium]